MPVSDPPGRELAVEDIAELRIDIHAISSDVICFFMLGLAWTAWAQSVTTIATGLNGPRGLEFGPDGALYVAEAGTGGTATGFDCEQVPAPVGPAFGGPTARVSRIANGQRETVISGLPSTMSSLPTQDTSGASDVTFLGGKMYVLLAGGGCSHGNPDAPNGIVRAKVFQGTWSYVADLSTYLMNNPTAVVEAYDYEPDGVFFSMVVHNGMFYAVEPNHGDIVRVNPGGRAERFIDISAADGHAVPTAIVYHDGYFYVGTLNIFPITPGSAKIYKISESGEIVSTITGLTTVTGLAFDSAGRLYALEMSDAPGFPVPGAGKVVRVNGPGQLEEIYSGLVVPTGLTVGPDDALYVSNFGAAPAGLGQIVRIVPAN